MKAKMTDLQRLVKDVYEGKQVMFNEVSGEDALRNMINEACGGQFNLKNFRGENMYRVFAILEEALDVNLGVVISTHFDNLAEVKNVPLGDQISFKVDDPSLFRVARIAGGTNDLRRQKLLNKRFTVETEKYGVKIFDELDMFIAGRIDWASMINRVAESFAHFMGTKIYQAIAESYTALNATYGVTGTLADDALFDMVQHVEAKSGKKAVIFGTKKALRKVSKTLNLSDGMKEKMNQVGYIDTVSGTDMYLLPQAHKIGTDEFFVDDNMLLVIPEGDKIVKILIEGEAFMLETAGAGDRNDQQMEYQIQKQFGIGVMQSAIYGIYKISA
ncbi:hypothetical protein [Bacillus cereus]|uniref:Phage capsid protein n=1 Tax=Bacillus cereus TaxID=1396 RepID=A0ABD4LMA3_BACCE|nr:hypothetical protein [Bacillus cereus]MBK1611782.1 hypothetical protein [Bacillus cereus]